MLLNISVALTWALVPVKGSPPANRDKLSSTVIGSKIYYFGGFGPQGATESDEVSTENYIGKV